MADVTISQLTQGVPANTALLPYTQGDVTYSVAPSALLQTSGNIGIGTNNPAQKLDVYGGGAFTFVEVGKSGQTGNRFAYVDLTGDDTYTDYGFRILRGNTGANADTALINRGSGLLSIAAGQAAGETGQVVISTANTERLRIDSSGNVGIGTSSPSQKLDVAGTVNATNIFKGGSEVPIGIGGMKLFTTAGVNTWTVPNLITKIKITAIGGGAGGGPGGGNAGGSSNITGINIVAGAGSGTTAGAATGDSSLLVYSAGGTSGVLGSTTTNPGFKLLGIASFGNGGASGTAGGSSGGTGAYASGVATVTPGATLTVNVGAGGSAKSGSGSSQSGSAGCVLIEW